MQTKRFAELAQVSPNTLRNWTGLFEPYLSPNASPPKGQPRILTDHDVQVLNYVSTLRDTGMSIEAIGERLHELQAGNWTELPAVPQEWRDGGDSVSVEMAASRASELAQLAVLQTELQHTRQALELAETRVRELELSLEELRDTSSGRERALYEQNAGNERRLRDEKDALEKELRSKVEATEEEKRALEEQQHTLEKQLLEVRAEAARLEGRLDSYSLGRGRPINVGVIIAGAVLFGILVVVVAVVIFAVLPG